MFTDMAQKYRDKFTIGFTYHADCYCYDCGADLPETDPAGNEKNPVATWDRAECPDWTCGKCDAPIDNWGY